MKPLSVQKIRKLEEAAKKIGFNERILIENASSNLAQIISDLKIGKKICVLAGRGNNGADVLACARKLVGRNFCVNIIIIQSIGKTLNTEAEFQREILEKSKIPFLVINEENINLLAEQLKDYELILDGIMGIGIKGELSDFIKKVIGVVNNSGKTIIACDTPSGLSPDDGKILGEAIRADYTITFVAAKRGFFLNKGKELCGKIFVTDIGISEEILRKVNEIKNARGGT